MANGSDTELWGQVNALRDRLVAMETTIERYPTEHRELQEKVARLETLCAGLPTSRELSELKIGINTLTTTLSVIDPVKLQEKVIESVRGQIATKQDVEWLTWWMRAAVGTGITGLGTLLLHMFGKL